MLQGTGLPYLCATPYALCALWGDLLVLLHRLLSSATAFHGSSSGQVLRVESRRELRLATARDRETQTVSKGMDGAPEACLIERHGAYY